VLRQPTARVLGRATGTDQQVALLRPIVPSVQPDPNEALRQVVNLIAADTTPCHLARPLVSGDRVEVSGFAATQRQLGEFGEALRTVSGGAVQHHGNLVAHAQCAALDFAKSLGGAERSLPLVLAAAEIVSGTELSGSIDAAERGEFYLIIVDDEGKVTEVPDDALRLENRSVVFSTPLTLTSGAVDTAQLLLAVASDQPLATIAAMNERHAPEYFAALKEEIALLGAKVNWGIAPFSIR
jgi:hypothetical protein